MQFPANSFRYFQFELAVSRLTLPLCKHSVITRAAYLTFAIQRNSFIYTVFVRLEMAPLRCKLWFARLCLSSVSASIQNRTSMTRNPRRLDERELQADSIFANFEVRPRTRRVVACNGHVTSAAIKTASCAGTARIYANISLGDRRYGREFRK